MDLSHILTIDLFLFGLCIGSFLNVVIYRLPLRTINFTLSTPRSHCPLCKHQLSWYENIPVFSWIVLRGRCRKCKASISIKYPIFEAVSGILLCLPTVIYGVSFTAVASGLTIITLLPYLYWISKKTKLNKYMFVWSIIPMSTLTISILCLKI